MKGVLGIIWRAFATFVLVGIITGCIVGCVLTVYIMQLMSADNSIDLEQVKMGYTSIIYANDSDGNDIILKRLYFGGEDRTWVDYDEISEHARKAVVAIEDKRFWTHDGVDWRRTLSAFLGMFGLTREGSTSGGGSTITQQLVKNVTGDSEVRVDRKVREIFRALDLNKNYSRQEILEAYLNIIPLGNGTNGIQAASNFYFDKSAAELTLAQSAAIVGITKYPGLYDPYTNPENNKDRQEWVLLQMLEQGEISQEEHDAAVEEVLVFRDHATTTATMGESSYFVDHVIEEVVADLMEYKGMTKVGATEALYSGGYRIYATVDLEMQAYLEEFFINLENFPSVRGDEYPESATVVLDPNGKILAVVGSNREKIGERTFNRATMSRRHPGSAIKPIGPYAMAFEYNVITWSTIIVDGPLTDGPEGWSPVNYYGGFEGPVTVDRAIHNSINTVSAKVAQQVGVRRIFDFLKYDLEFDGLVEYEAQGGQILSDVALSPMSLGALTYGVSPLEMAGAYTMFINGGLFTPPYSYTRIEDANGDLVLEKDTTARRVLGEDTAVVLNKLLQRVTSVGTGRQATLNNGMPTAGKTGTSQDNVNQWFMGFSPYYVAPAWLGHDRTTRVVVNASTGRRSVVPNTVDYTGYLYPPPILWKSIMQPLHDDLEPIPFIDSPNVVSKLYCTASGGIATQYCPSTASGWYKTSRLPSNCILHSYETTIAEETTIDDDTGDDDDDDFGIDIRNS